MALREAVKKADPVILEPLMKVEVETPQEFQGFVIGDLSSRRGVIQGSENNTSGDAIITAHVPLSEMFGYSTQLRSGTQGKAGYSMEFEKYAECPSHIQDKVMEERKEKLQERAD